MKCKYGNLWLTGTPWQEDCGAVQLSAQQLASVIPLIGAASPSVRGMGNVVDTLPVPIILQLASELDVLRYIAELPWLLPNSGTLLLSEQIGTVKLEILYATAIWTGVQRSRSGTAAILTYNFTVKGPPTFTVTGSAPLDLADESGSSLTTET